MKYAALFRGINVGGKNAVRMADLKRMLEGLGLRGAATYIQSGNAVFEADADAPALKAAIEAGFVDRFGFAGVAAIRSADELCAVVGNLPFTPAEIAAAEAANPEVEHLYVYFLDGPVKRGEAEALSAGVAGSDRLRAGEKELYLLCFGSVRDSKPAARVSRAFPSATARNWKTVMKLLELAGGSTAP
ncbi:MAG: DUF1697 domain-containing protein [Clostridiales bacterium]|nr:DUF1697 domain-containing protein [Clostridiales bacterium]